MNRVLQLLRRRLIGANRPLCVGLKVDVNLALGYDIARLRVIFKVAAVDLVEAVGFTAVDDDVYVLELGLAGFSLVSDFAGCMDGEDCSSAQRVGVGESLGVLLDLDGQLLRQLAHCLANSISRIAKKSGDNQQHARCCDHQPVAQTLDSGMHRYSILLQEDSPRMVGGRENRAIWPLDGWAIAVDQAMD